MTDGESTLGWRGYPPASHDRSRSWDVRALAAEGRAPGVRPPERAVVLRRRAGRWGTALRASAPRSWAATAVLAGTVVLSLLVVADGLPRRSEEPVGLPVVLPWLAAAVLAVLVLARVVPGAGRPGDVVLDAVGIHRRGAVSWTSLRWDEVAALHVTSFHRAQTVSVVGRPGSAVTPRWSRWLRWALRDRGDGLRMIEIHCFPLGVDPIRVQHLVSLYLQHPAARSELGTAASLRRVGRGTA